MGNGTWVGLDVHAKSVVAGVICDDTGELRVMRPPTAPRIWCGGCVNSIPRCGWPMKQGRPGLASRGALRARYRVRGGGPEPDRTLAGGTQPEKRCPDAEHLARLLRQGELTPVRIPDPADEAARDLVRAREDARADLMRARHRLSKLLLRHGVVYESGRAWTRAHDGWLRRQQFARPAARAAFDDAYDAVLGVRDPPRAARLRDRPDGKRPPLGRCRRTPRVPARRRDTDRICAVCGDRRLASAHGRHDRRVSGPGANESQSGARHARGPITKAGNSHARRLLVEAAWHHRQPLRTSAAIEARRSGQRPEVCARAEAAGVRLHHRWYHLERRRGRAFHDRRHGCGPGARRLVLEPCGDGLNAHPNAWAQRARRPAGNGRREGRCAVQL